MLTRRTIRHRTIACARVESWIDLIKLCLGADVPRIAAKAQALGTRALP
jgi:hypothetical protein